MATFPRLVVVMVWESMSVLTRAIFLPYVCSATVTMASLGKFPEILVIPGAMRSEPLQMCGMAPASTVIVGILSRILVLLSVGRRSFSVLRKAGLPSMRMS